MPLIYGRLTTVSGLRTAPTLAPVEENDEVVLNGTLPLILALMYSGIEETN
jgi:hypothetical protein